MRNEINIIIKKYEYRIKELEYCELLNEQYQKFFFDKINKIILKKNIDIKSNNDNINLESVDVENKKEDKDIFIKNLYKKISKLTHPDKTNNSYFNDLYLKSKYYYDTDNISGLIYISNIIGLDIEIDEVNMNKFLEDILFIENKIHFLKTSLVWRWNE